MPEEQWDSPNYLVPERFEYVILVHPGEGLDLCALSTVDQTAEDRSLPRRRRYSRTARLPRAPGSRRRSGSGTAERTRFSILSLCCWYLMAK